MAAVIAGDPFQREEMETSKNTGVNAGGRLFGTVVEIAFRRAADATERNGTNGFPERIAPAARFREANSVNRYGPPDSF